MLHGSAPLRRRGGPPAKETVQYSGPGLRSKIENKLRLLRPDFRNTVSSRTARPQVLRLHQSRKCPLSCARRRVQLLYITCRLRVVASQSIGQPRSSLRFRKTASTSNGVSIRGQTQVPDGMASCVAREQEPNGTMAFTEGAANLMQRLARLPAAPHLDPLLGGKPVPFSLCHKHHL